MAAKPGDGFADAPDAGSINSEKTETLVVRRYFSIITAFVLACSCSGYASAAEPPTLKAELPEGTVTVTFPAVSFEVGDEKPFKVMVSPAPGKSPPDTVRGRFGMPYMGHWVTDEQTQTYSEAGMEFMSNIAMYGVYRFRIWLDYAGGVGAKTAVDFKVMADKGLEAEVAGE